MLPVRFDNYRTSEVQSTNFSLPYLISRLKGDSNLLTMGYVRAVFHPVSGNHQRRTWVAPGWPNKHNRPNANLFGSGGKWTVIWIRGRRLLRRQWRCNGFMPF